jgi:hypothetical protein
MNGKPDIDQILGNKKARLTAAEAKRLASGELEVLLVIRAGRFADCESLLSSGRYRVVIRPQSNQMCGILIGIPAPAEVMEVLGADWLESVEANAQVYPTKKDSPSGEKRP